MAPFVAQWGILGCGWISSEFVKDAVRDPSERKVSDVYHAIAAVGSRDISKAEKFIQENCPEGASGQKNGLVDIKPKAYGSYKEVVDDPNVNIVYVGTMNVSHFTDAKLALDGGKHCLLEKPATLNAAEWRVLSALAKEKGVFLMEAVWTRFNPTMLAVQKEVFSGTIGDIRAVYSDLSMDVLDSVADSHRLFAAELAGGPLLDLGPYPLVWTMMMLYRHPKNERSAPENLGSSMLKHKTGVDLATSFTLTFPKIKAIAYCTTNLLSTTSAEHTRIVGSKGEIFVGGHTSRPTKYTVRLIDPELAKNPNPHAYRFQPDQVTDLSFEGFGLYWEADQVARYLRDGLTEAPDMTHAETEMTMGIFDSVRKAGGYEFQQGLEQVKLG